MRWLMRAMVLLAGLLFIGGFLLPVGDTTSMAREALGLLRDKERLAQFKYQAGKLSHERFAQEKVVSHYEAYYKQVLNG